MKGTRRIGDRSEKKIVEAQTKRQALGERNDGSDSVDVNDGSGGVNLNHGSDGVNINDGSDGVDIRTVPVSRVLVARSKGNINAFRGSNVDNLSQRSRGIRSSSRFEAAPVVKWGGRQEMKKDDGLKWARQDNRMRDHDS